MATKRAPEEFKIEAGNRVSERGHSAPDVANRLAVFQLVLYEWIKKDGLPKADRIEQAEPMAETAPQGRSEAHY